MAAKPRLFTIADPSASLRINYARDPPCAAQNFWQLDSVDTRLVIDTGAEPLNLPR
jgi:hypothetical protein